MAGQASFARREAELVAVLALVALFARALVLEVLVEAIETLDLLWETYLSKMASGDHH